MNTALLKLERELETTSAPLLDPMDAFEWFLQIDVAQGDATADTIIAYRREVGLWIEWCQERNLIPIEAKRIDIEMYREGLKARGIAATTRAFKLSIIRRFYAAAVRHELIHKNPAEGVRPGKNLTAPEDSMKALGIGALSKLVDAIPADSIAGIRDSTLR